MALTKRHLGEVCLLHHIDATKTCRYLMNDELDSSKWYCQKLRPLSKIQIDEHVSSMSRNSQLAYRVPAGDNCDGYPLLKHLPQGFDAD